MEEPTDETSARALLKKLDDRLIARRPHLAKLDRYYEGDHPLLFASQRFKKAFGGTFDAFADNWCELVVDSVEERLTPTGFRLGDAAEGDAEAWRIWQANGLDADSQIGHTNALVHGAGYVMIGPGDDPATPLITIEDAHEVLVEHDPARRRDRVAAIKRYRDDNDGVEYATLYTPNWVWRFQAKAPDPHVTVTQALRWERRDIDGRAWPERNEAGVVPIVPLYNRPRGRRGKIDTWGRSELGPVIPQQNAINKLVMDLLVTSEFSAFPQRWATGLMDDTEDANQGSAEGPTEFEQRVERFVAGASTLFTVEDDKTKFGQFAAADLGNFVKAIEMMVQHIASQTRTPPHYFYLSGNFPSGESIKSAETGLVAKARRKMRHFGEGWEEVIRVAGLFAGNEELAAAHSAETMWADPESRSESERVDALTKLATLGVPQRQLWEDAGYSPQQIARFDAMAVQDALTGFLAAPDAPQEPPVADPVT